MSNEMTRYGAVDLAAIEEDEREFEREAAERKARRGFLQMPEGRTVIRVMPPWSPSAKRPYKKVWMHKVRNPADPGKPGISVPCPAKNFGKPCALLCKRVQELRLSPAKVDKDAAFDLSAQARYFMSVVNVADMDAGVKLWEFGPRVYEQVFKLLKDEAGRAVDYTHPETGHNLIVERTGKAKNDTRYFLKLAMKPSPIPNKAWLRDLPDLDKIASLMADDAVQAILEGRAEEFPPPDDEVGASSGRTASQDLEEDPETGMYIPKGARR